MQLVETPAGVRSEARWQEAATEVLLAPADQVRMVDRRGREVVVAWSSLERLASGCLGSTDLDPPRHRARWPSDDTIEALARG